MSDFHEMELIGMREDYMIVMVVASRQYMSIREMSTYYGMKRPTIYNIIKEMESCGRYRYDQISINDYGDKLVDTLAFEDYLLNRTSLKNRNLARRLPPYDPTEVRKRRGEFQIIKDLSSL